MVRGRMAGVSIEPDWPTIRLRARYFSASRIFWNAALALSAAADESPPALFE